MQYRSAEILLIDPDGAEPLLAKLTELGFSVTIDGTLATATTEEPWGTDQAPIQIATGLDALAFWNWLEETISPFGAGMAGLGGTIADYDPQGRGGPCVLKAVEVRSMNRPWSTAKKEPSRELVLSTMSSATRRPSSPIIALLRRSRESRRL
jgi:hypothetical protein